MPLFKKKTRPLPIQDPLQHAAASFHRDYTLKTSIVALQGAATYHTTGEFSRLSRRYRSHCCPTAITNVLFSFFQAGKAPMLTDRHAEDIFEETARWGSRRLLYWNMSIKDFFGGVAMPFTGLYLRAILKRWDVHPKRVHLSLLLPRTRLIKRLCQGDLGLICVLFHPLYYSHTMMVCGMDILEDSEGHELHYLRLADGWASRPRYLCLEQLRRFLVWTIQP